MSTTTSTTGNGSAGAEDFGAAARAASERVSQATYYKRRAVVGLAAAGVLAGGTAGTAAVVDALNGPEPAAIESVDVGSEAFLTALAAEATQPADPLDIQEAFVISSEDPGWLVTQAESIAVTLPGYEENQDIIDHTINQSALDQGIYHEGDMFAVSKAEIMGIDTYIVQPVSDESQLNTESK